MFPDYNAYSQFYGGLSNGFDYRAINGGSMLNMGVNSDEVITVSQAVLMIRMELGDFREQDLFLDRLIRVASNDRSKDIIRGIKEDNQRHNRVLRDVYYSLTGQMFMDDRQGQQIGMPNLQPNMDKQDRPEKPDNDDKDYNCLLEKLLFDVFECVVRFRRIMGAMPSGENYVLLMSILTDEVINIGKINYLFGLEKG